MNISYLAVLDHEHLDNGLFLTSFAKAVAEHQHRGLILHSDSQYTDRIMQTGVMREQAQQRAIKDLNHRLIALLADHGISAIGINGYQRELITVNNGEIKIDKKKLLDLPEQPVLLISALIHSENENKPVAKSLPEIALALKTSLKVEDSYLFTKSEENDVIKKVLPERLSEVENKSEFINSTVPDEFLQVIGGFKLTTAVDFGKYPNISNQTLLD